MSKTTVSSKLIHAAICIMLQSDVCLLKSLDPADQITDYTTMAWNPKHRILQTIENKSITTERLQAVVADSIFCFRPEDLCDARHDSWNNVDLLVINTVYNFTCIVLSSLSGSTKFLTPKGKLLIRLKLLDSTHIILPVHKWFQIRWRKINTIE